MPIYTIPVNGDTADILFRACPPGKRFLDFAGDILNSFARAWAAEDDYYRAHPDGANRLSVVERQLCKS